MLLAAEEMVGAAAEQGAVHQSGAGVMLLLAGIMLVTYAGVAYERFHKTAAALLGGVVAVAVSVALGVFDYPVVNEILAKDLNIFGVIIGTGILVDVVGRSGLFHFLSMWIVRLTGGEARKLYFALCLLTFLFVAVLTIVPAMLILSSLVLVICRSLRYKPTPMLLTVAICANSGAIATFASGLPNIMVGTAAGIPYVHFLQVSLPYAVVSLVMAVALLRFFFRRDLPWRQSEAERRLLGETIAAFDPWAMVEDRFVLLRSAIILLATVIGFASAQLLGVGMEFIAMAGASAALLFAGKGVEDAIHKVNWTVILFFLGLFAIIGCVEHTGALNLISMQVIALSGGRLQALVPLLCVFSAGASAIVDNIPVAATLIPIVQSIGASGTPIEPLWWSLILCSNLGGNGTPIGSISCVIALHTLKKDANVHVGWGTFIKIGGTIMLVQVLGAIVYVLAMHWAGWIPPLEAVRL